VAPRVPDQRRLQACAFSPPAWAPSGTDQIGHDEPHTNRPAISFGRSSNYVPDRGLLRSLFPFFFPPPDLERLHLRQPRRPKRRHSRFASGSPKNYGTTLDAFGFSGPAAGSRGSQQPSIGLLPPPRVLTVAIPLIVADPRAPGSAFAPRLQVRGQRTPWSCVRPPPIPPPPPGWVPSHTLPRIPPLTVMLTSWAGSSATNTTTCLPAVWVPLVVLPPNVFHAGCPSPDTYMMAHYSFSKPWARADLEEGPVA